MSFPRTLARLAAVAVLAAQGTACSTTDAADQPPASASGPYVAAQDAIQAGEYITTLGGCNDCHTPGWEETAGQVPVADRLTGSPVGFQGPWGTSYPANLRLSVQGHTAETWIGMVRARTGNPPMPWMNLHAMSDRDLAAVFQFLRQLGPKGVPAPAFVPPGREPVTPYIDFTPRNLPTG